MKIFFIHCNINTGNGPHFVPGLASVSSFLKAAGHQTSLITLHEEIDRTSLLNRIREEAPGLIGFTTLTNQWPFILKYTRWIKEDFSIPILHGGVHVTVAAEESIQSPGVDLICVGEGEFPMLELVERLEKGNPYDDILNIWIKKPNGQIIKNPLRPLIQDLDALPFQDRELFNYRLLQRSGNHLNSALVMAGRGCPFSCTYCVNNAMHKLYRCDETYCRMRSPERVIQELQYLFREYGTDRFTIYDDTFTYDHRWLKRFCALYEKTIHLPFIVNVRIGTVNEAVLTMLKKAGCEMLIVGIESGSERVRREILDRKMSNEEIIHIFQITKKLGLKTWTNNMIGLPTETPEEAEATLELNRLIRPTRAQITIFYPYPGTELYARCQQEGYLSDREESSFIAGSVLNLPTLTLDQISHYVDEFRNWAVRNWAEWESENPYFDFFINLPNAKVVTEQEAYVQPNAETINGKERLVVLAHPESSISYTLQFPEQSKLSFGFGLSPLVWSPDKGGGLFFEITITENGKERLLFSRFIDPKNNAFDRKWHNIELDLNNSSPGVKTINFITTTKGEPNYFCWARWSHPVLYGPKPAARPDKSRLDA